MLNRFGIQKSINEFSSTINFSVIGPLTVSGENILDFGHFIGGHLSSLRFLLTTVMQTSKLSVLALDNLQYKVQTLLSNDLGN
jgi:hypothetical protein